jgi:hypothetical protein
METRPASTRYAQIDPAPCISNYARQRTESIAEAA